MTYLETAELFARRAHEKQFRKDGVTPYIVHQERIVKSLKDFSEDFKVIAWLHDVLEDTDTTFEQLEEKFDDLTCNAVSLLTRSEGESYNHYLLCLRDSRYARIVKIADMLDNLTDDPSEENRQKYIKGILYLSRG